MIDESLEPDKADDATSEPDAAADETSHEGRVLEPAEVCFRRDGGRLQMRDDDGEWREVSAVRLFPLSEPDRYVSIIDAEQAEIGVFEDLSSLPPEQREIVEEELRRRYLTPIITEILSIRHRYDTSEWTVETNRGPAVFIMRNIREKVREPLPRHLTLEDAEGNRFDIPDIETLDPESRRLLDQEI